MSEILTFPGVELESSIDICGFVHVGPVMRKAVLKDMGKVVDRIGSFGADDFSAVTRDVLEAEGYVEVHDGFRLASGQRRYRLTAAGRAEAGL